VIETSSIRVCSPLSFPPEDGDIHTLDFFSLRWWTVFINVSHVYYNTLSSELLVEQIFILSQFLIKFCNVLHISEAFYYTLRIECYFICLQIRLWKFHNRCCIINVMLRHISIMESIFWVMNITVNTWSQFSCFRFFTFCNERCHLKISNAWYPRYRHKICNEEES
jgi:hypothetical protein